MILFYFLWPADLTQRHAGCLSAVFIHIRLNLEFV